MTGTNDTQYQPDELRAIASFEAIGIFETLNRLNQLGNTAQRRWAECFHKNGSVPYGYTAIDFLSPGEREEHHLLRLSLTLCVDERSEAQERIKARLIARYEESKKKRGAVCN